MSLMRYYEKLDKLGEGTYGVVYKARDIRDDSIVALKMIRLEGEDEGIPPTSIREISILHELNHPNIVKVNGVINQPKNLTIVFEFLDKDLKKYIDRNPGKMNSDLIRSFSFQIICGLCYCHCHRIIHRDIKPQNLLLNRSGYIKLADFGLARAFTIPLRIYTHEVVTMWYRAPEILLGSQYYSLPIDIWSAGCVIAEMFNGKPLFRGDSEIDQLYKIFNILGTPTEENFPGVEQMPNYSIMFPKWKPMDLADVIKTDDEEALDLISRMLQFDPANRISAKEAINHPYFRSISQEMRAACVPDEIQ